MTGISALEKKESKPRVPEKASLGIERQQERCFSESFRKTRKTYKAAPPSKLRHCEAIILETKVQHPIKGIIILSVSSVRLVVSWFS